MRARIADTFTESVSRLEGPERNAVKRAAFDYLTGAARPGHRLHRVHAEDRRFWSLRVNRDLRIIVHRAEDEVVLCFADHHDRAYAWATHRAGAPPADDGRAAPVELARASPPRDAVATAAREPAPRARDDRPPLARDEGDAAPRRPTARASRHHLRVLRRAVAPLPPDVDPAPAGAAPAPLVHLLRFFEERERRPAGPAGAGAPAEAAPESAPPGASCGDLAAGPVAGLAAALIAPWVAAAGVGLDALAAAAIALGQALCVGWYLRGRARRLAAARREADLEVAALAAALEALRRGEAPAMPRALPAGALGRAWTAIERLGCFLALPAADIRDLAERPVGRAAGEG